MNPVGRIDYDMPAFSLLLFRVSSTTRQTVKSNLHGQAKTSTHLSGSIYHNPADIGYSYFRNLLGTMSNLNPFGVSNKRTHHLN